jgi:predicted nicotinamide N-methyase
MLELGCGTGLIGLSLAVLLENCHVTLTDLSQGAELAEHNISINQRQFAPNSDAQFRVLDWANRPDWLEEFHLVVIGDCIYNPDAHDNLVATMKHVSGTETLILLAYKVRHEAEAAFDHLLLKMGFVEHKRVDVLLPNEEHVADEMVHIKTLSNGRPSSHLGWAQDRIWPDFLY